MVWLWSGCGGRCLLLQPPMRCSTAARPAVVSEALPKFPWGTSNDISNRLSQPSPQYRITAPSIVEHVGHGERDSWGSADWRETHDYTRYTGGSWGGGVGEPWRLTARGQS